MTRGGKRPGAGAPRGNLNGLKHGLHSKQLASIGLIFASNPRILEALLSLGRRHQIRQQKGEEVAALFFAHTPARRPGQRPAPAAGHQRPQRRR